MHAGFTQDLTNEDFFADKRVTVHAAKLLLTAAELNELLRVRRKCKEGLRQGRTSCFLAGNWRASL
jgi:hypothetical protein